MLRIGAMQRGCGGFSLLGACALGSKGPSLSESSYNVASCHQRGAVGGLQVMAAAELCPWAPDGGMCYVLGWFQRGCGGFSLLEASVFDDAPII